MNTLQKQIGLIERIDQLIRLKATGSPKEMAIKLKISESTVYRIMDTMKGLGAPVEYKTFYQSYVYVNEARFHCGFLIKELKEDEYKKVNGGFSKMGVFMQAFSATVRI